MSFLSNLGLKLESLVFSLLILFIPTQLGKHYWPDFSIVSGIRIDYLSPTFYVTDLFVILLLVIWILRRFNKFTLKQLFKFKILVLILAFLLVNIYYSQNFFNGLYHLLKFVEFAFVAYYVTLVIRKEDQIARLALLLSCGVIFESLLAIVQFIKQGSIGGIFYLLGERTFDPLTPGIANASLSGELILRPYATFSHPNVLSGFLLLAMIFGFFTLSLQKNYWQKKVIQLSLFVGTAALILTLSRVSILLWFTLLLIIFVSQLKKLKKSFLLFTFLLAVGGMLVFGQSSLANRFLATRLTEEAVVQREVLMKASVALIAKHSLTGVGLGNFIPSLAVVQKPLSFGLYLQPVHNIFLLILTETGLIGFSFWIWFLIKTYRHLILNIKQLGKNNLGYFAAFVLTTVLLMLGLFDHYFLTLQQGQLLLALILGLSWTTIKG